jgi:hypothetical protein
VLKATANASGFYTLTQKHIQLPQQKMLWAIIGENSAKD